VRLVSAQLSAWRLLRSARDFLDRRIVRDAIRLIGLLIVLFVFWLLAFHDYQHDARAYWTANLAHLYERAEVGGRDAYLYSPLFAQLIQPLTWLPWSVFAAVWAALNLGALTWMAGPAIAALLLVIPGSPVIDEVATGNIHLLIGAALVLAMRYPGWWAFPLLTKVTPAAGMAYLIGAQRWRQMGVAVGVTALLSLVSFILGPHLWFDWVGSLASNAGRSLPNEIAVIPGPLIVRTAVAGVIALIGGFRGWRWTVPVAAVIALPVPWSSGLAVLVAVIAMARRGMLTEPPADR
jgi:hypothetical protein